MSAPSTCVLSGHVYTAAGAAYENALVRLRINGGSTLSAAGDGFAASEAQKTYTDAAGAWSLTVPRGELFWIEIPTSHISSIGTVPSAATADLSEVTLEEYEP